VSVRSSSNYYNCGCDNTAFAGFRSALPGLTLSSRLPWLSQQRVREEAMRMSSFVLAVLVLTAEAKPSMSEDTTSRPKMISEDALRLVSAEAYFALLRRAQANGWRYSLIAIQKGHIRHFEELKLQLLDQGYTIISDEPGCFHRVRTRADSSHR
jgi:hypothetical protein